MTAFSEMKPEDRGLLIGLPYRVGIWMSHADDEDGEGDDSRELKALEHIIRSIARAHDDNSIIDEIAQETLKRKEKWPVWAKHSFDILGDCQKAVAVLKSNAGAGDLRDYRKALVHIAEAVAAAHGEFGMDIPHEESRLSAFLTKVVDRIKGEGEEADFMNISPAEEDALIRLKTALKGPDA